MLDKPEVVFFCEECSPWWLKAFLTRDPLVQTDLLVLDELFALHWKLIATDQDVAKLDIDFTKYLRLAEMKMFTMVLARNNVATIIGYFACLITPHPHYKSTLMALEDVHFVHPDYRRHGVGTEMLGVMEDVLRARDVKLLKVRSKVHAPNTEWLRQNGFKAVELTYSKVL